MASKIHLRIVTPTRSMFDDDADMVIMRGIDGDVGVLTGHAPFSTVLGLGVLKIKSGDTTREASVLGGYAQVTNNVLTILSDTAEWPEEIDMNRAKAARDRAERLIQQKMANLDLQRAELALERALVRIEVAETATTRR